MKARIRTNTIVFLVFIGIFFTLYNVQGVKSSKNTIKELEKEITYQETQLSETLESQVCTANNYIPSTSSAPVAQTGCDITYEDGFRVNGTIDVSNGEGVFYRLDNNEINYDSASESNIIEDYFISFSNDTKETQATQTYEVNDTDRIICSTKLFDDNLSLTALKTVDGDENPDMDVLLEKAFRSEKENHYSINGLPINDTFTNRVTISDEAVVFYDENGNEIVFTKYQDTINEDYFTEKTTINECPVKYGSIINEADNLVFYVFEQDTPLLMFANKDVPIETIFREK